jgi:hypothetical protein
MLNGRELDHGSINRIRKSRDDPISEIFTGMRKKGLYRIIIAVDFRRPDGVDFPGSCESLGWRDQTKSRKSRLCSE